MLWFNLSIYRFQQFQSPVTAMVETYSGKHGLRTQLNALLEIGGTKVHSRATTIGYRPPDVPDTCQKDDHLLICSVRGGAEPLTFC